MHLKSDSQPAYLNVDAYKELSPEFLTAIHAKALDYELFIDEILVASWRVEAFKSTPENRHPSQVAYIRLQPLAKSVRATVNLGDQKISETQSLQDSSKNIFAFVDLQTKEGQKPKLVVQIQSTRFSWQ